MASGKTRLPIGIFFALSIILAGCGRANELASARMQWASTGPEDYSLTVRHTQSVWHSQSITVTVIDGKISHSAKCTPAPTEGKTCEVIPYNPEVFTVEGLFQTADRLLAGDLAKHVNIEYESTLGYPTFIRLDDPDVIDEEQFWKIVAFKAIE